MMDRGLSCNGRDSGSSECTVAPPRPEDRDDWATLYRDYGEFTGIALTDEMLGRVWTWLLDDTQELRGLLAHRAESVIALAHYRIHARPMSATWNLYVHDLYVSESCRRQGIGTRLMDALVQTARDEQCSSVYWHTKQDNNLARAFYDRLSDRMTWVLYEIELK